MKLITIEEMCPWQMAEALASAVTWPNTGESYVPDNVRLRRALVLVEFLKMPESELRRLLFEMLKKDKIEPIKFRFAVRDPVTPPL